MPFTARQLPNTFHVSYGPTFSTQIIGLPLQTETGLDIMTETSQVIYAESVASVIMLKAHRIGPSEFRVTGIGST